MIENSFETAQAFAEYVHSDRYGFSKIVVNGCFNLYESEEDSLIVMSSFIEEYQNYFDITINKEDLLITLKQNLKIYEQEEDYEGCAKIYELIKKL